jgi:hypothetical protein
MPAGRRLSMMTVLSKLCLLTLSTCLVVLATLSTAAAAARTSRAKTIASYCSSSGDVCFGVFHRGGKVLLRITTASRYFRRYTLCVTRLPRASNPEHAQHCGSFPVFRQSGSTWGSSVNYARQFVGPVAHPLAPLPGRYQVTWRQVCSQCGPKEQRHSAAGPPLGPSLYFRLPLS